MYVIAAFYGVDRCLYYAGPADMENASRYGVHRFTDQRDRATVFSDFFPAMRASWRATPPRKHDGNMLTSVKVNEAAKRGQ